MNRKEKSVALLKEHVNKLKCPLCAKGLYIEEDKSLKCENKHTFDIAKQGYVNLLSTPHKTAYDKELFLSRKEIIREIKFYEPLQQVIATIVSERMNQEELFIADVGCGEGSHLHMLGHLIDNIRLVGAGIDISKEGIMVAAKNDENHLWLVGDLANIPLADNSTDIILDILSPSNYKEFLRILSPKGMMLKIVPSTNYLKEIRQEIFEEVEKHTYVRDEKIIELFYEHFTNVEIVPVSYQVQLNENQMENLLRMTPLTWNQSEEKLRMLKKGLQKITVDLEILIGKN